ncbi:hypothetical protein ANN_16341 [Periplaneta americana]|uniref:Uncharacterized protein n=1 Tax=Periplaneta americana TaxID=6978 RepID=A0ABQ8SIT6_PERAM|nr:hypothetical protein ANN_16341 [Periplaneta americana]
MGGRNARISADYEERSKRQQPSANSSTCKQLLPEIDAQATSTLHSKSTDGRRKRIYQESSRRESSASTEGSCQNPGPSTANGLLEQTANPTIGTTHPHPYHRQLHIAEPKSAVVQETLKTTTNSVETGRLSKMLNLSTSSDTADICVLTTQHRKELRQPSFYRGACRSRWGKSGCDIGKRTVPVRKYDSILKALSSLENANIFLERTILTNSVLFTICGLDSVWRAVGTSLVEGVGVKYIQKLRYKTMGIINTIMKPSLVQRHIRIRLYKTLARPALCYGSEAWTLRKKDESRITANEMKFIRYTAGYTKWDHKRNEDVMEELQLEPVINHVKHYQNNWIFHLHRMHRDRILLSSKWEEVSRSSEEALD